jgi:hypothetical protein
MEGLNRRVGALEEFVEAQVRARMEAEIEALLDLLEKHLTPEEFLKVARIVMESREDTNGT